MGIWKDGMGIGDIELCVCSVFFCFFFSQVLEPSF
jgi:hypothetical protein